MYEYWTKLCAFCTASLYSPRLQSIICCYVSADGHSTTAVQPLSFLPLTPLPPSGSRIYSEPAAYKLGLSLATLCYRQYPLIVRGIPDIFFSFRPQSAEILSSVSLKMSDALVHDLLQTTHSDRFDISLFKSTSKYTNDNKDVVQRNGEKSCDQKWISELHSAKSEWPYHKTCSQLQARCYNTFSRKV